VATEFFTTEVWTWCGLVIHYILFFFHVGSRRIHIAGVTSHPNESWMKQIVRNETMETWGFLEIQGAPQAPDGRRNLPRERALRLQEVPTGPADGRDAHV
jgi:hypothetical protein